MILQSMEFPIFFYHFGLPVSQIRIRNSIRVISHVCLFYIFFSGVQSDVLFCFVFRSQLSKAELEDRNLSKETLKEYGTFYITINTF
jgi:hypothetical protein